MEELQEQPQLLNVEQGAITKIKEILAEEDNPDLMLRMFVSGGGCSGMQYGFTLEETKNEDDFDIEVDGGINKDTSKACIEAGANVLVAGNAIFSEDANNYTNLINLLRGPN